MCGGIISESLVQNLAADGINLPPTVVQRGIDSYMLHTDQGSVRIKTPLQEKRIAAIFRGSGPRDIREIKWKSFDGHLQKLTSEKGAQVLAERIRGISFDETGRPVLRTSSRAEKTYDLLVVATGVNSPIMRQLGELDIGYKPPVTTKTYICEYYLGSEIIEKVLGSSMHVFLLNIPRLKFAAIIPKGDYVTVCMLGEDIDDKMIDDFLGSSIVDHCMPQGWQKDRSSCKCAALMNVQGAVQPFADRVVVIGDTGVTRLYKDGIGAAYRTAKAAAATAVFQGISQEDFQRHFWPVCQNILADNAIGKLTFLVTSMIQKISIARRGLVRMTRREQENHHLQPRMSLVMWDMFTGSAPYQVILARTLHPAFISRFVANILLSIPRSQVRPG
jgi:flavin-dependent dehydrogenase